MGDSSDEIPGGVHISITPAALESAAALAEETHSEVASDKAEAGSMVHFPEDVASEAASVAEAEIGSTANVTAGSMDEDAWVNRDAEFPESTSDAGTDTHASGGEHFDTSECNAFSDPGYSSDTGAAHSTSAVHSDSGPGPSGRSSSSLAEGSGNQEDAEAKPMSKKQAKKMAKYLARQDNIKKKKEEQKLKNEQDKAERERMLKERLANMTAEELAESRKRKAEIIETQRDRKRQKAEKLEAAMQSGIRVAIDLEFADMHNERDQKSLCQQILFSYGVNVRAAKPFRFYLTSLTGGMRERMNNVCGFNNWTILVESKPYIEMFDKDELVYLTADADTVLTEINPNHVYIIGGIVDRNRYKGITNDKAIKQGIKTARLPIEEHVSFGSGSKVLLVNQVFNILAHFSESGDWQQALFAVLPARKQPEAKKPSQNRTLSADNPSGDSSRDPYSSRGEESGE